MSSNSSAISRANDRRGVRYPYGGCDRAVDAEHVATIAVSSGGNAVIVPHSDATGANNATAGEQMSAPFLIDILTIGASARSRRLRVSAVMTSFPTCNGTIRAARRRTSAPIAEPGQAPGLGHFAYAAALATRRRRIIPPIAPKPTSMLIQVAASGTAPVGWNVAPKNEVPSLT
jgi:hypothetical protein